MSLRPHLFQFRSIIILIWSALCKFRLSTCWFLMILTISLNFLPLRRFQNTMGEIYGMSTETCLFSLFQDDTFAIKADCKFQVLKSSDITTKLYVLNYPQILLCSPHYLSVTCPHQYTSPPPCSYCFYSVPCACSVQTIHLFLPPRVSHCNTSNSLPLSSPLQYPVNLALLCSEMRYKSFWLPPARIRFLL